MDGSEVRVPPISGQLTLIFDVHINKKYGILKPEVQQLVLERSYSAKLGGLTDHLEDNLQLECGEGRKLLLHAICDRTEARVAGRLREIKGIVPLVCDQVWTLVLTNYPHSQLKVLVEQNRPTTVQHKRSLTSCMKIGFWRHELLLLNVAKYFPTKSLVSDHIMHLCRDIFENGLKIKHELRKGVWPHLVGVFPPGMKTREERELYFNKLRRVYDSLRGKWIGVNDNDDVRHLLDAVRRDAVRTDPGHPFYKVSEAHYNSQINLHESSDEDNIQKLVNIITIYTLEHKSCAYTQGMTDILSPILYVMRHEADAYICFSAMVERILNHFETWCVGTVLKLERLKHLCEVLDPELYFHLRENIEEDSFALFFGMVLIECRREFSFEDSFHLLESIWAAVACMKDSLPRTTTLTGTEWASYMTQVSPIVVQQVMGESECPYSAVPLPMSESMYDAYSRSRQASMLSQGSTTAHDHFHSGASGNAPAFSRVISHAEVIDEEGERDKSSNAETSSLAEVSVSEVTTVEKRPRSYTDPSDSALEQVDHSLKKKKGLSDSHSESEVIDSYSSQPPPIKQKSSSSSRAVTEMSDMSSLSSNNALANSYKSFDSKNASGNGRNSAASDRSQSPACKVIANGHIPSVAPPDEADGPTFAIGGDGAMVGLSSHKDEKNNGKVAISEVATLNSRDGPTKEQVISTVEENGVLPKQQPSFASAMSSRYESALSMLTDGREEEGSSDSEDYQTANNGNSDTDLPSRSASLTPADDDQRSTLTAATVNGDDLSDPRLNEDDATPVHVTQAIPNGTVVQGACEHLRAELVAGDSFPFTPTMEASDDSSGKHTKREEKSACVKPVKEQSSQTPVSRRRTKAEPIQSSPLDIIDGEAISGSSRVTPVTFFDAMQQLASSVSGSVPSFLQSGHVQQHSLSGRDEQREGENDLELSQANSMILSQLIHTDRSAPRVSREKSLELPVSDCFPLFICLSILVQHRIEIMQRNIDFVGLSVLLNAQAGTGDLNVTLRVAGKLYKAYREYQMTYFGSRPQDLDTWLDDDRTSGHDQAEPTGEDHLNDRTSVASDDVFTH